MGYDMFDAAAVLDETFAADEQSDYVVPRRPGGLRTTMMIAFREGVGAAYFVDDSGPFVTRNAAPLKAPPFVAVDSHVPYFFPPEAVLPLPVLQDVVSEYLHTGQRPVQVDWILVNWHTVVG